MSFLYGEMQREVFIELPAEDAWKHGRELVGLLRRSMYGLQYAPQIWQRVVVDMLSKRGFVPLITAQCVYVNSISGVLPVTHVDDFLFCGSRPELDGLLGVLEGELECS